MNQIAKWTNYTEMDQEIAKQLENVATGFIYLGYLFKQARDTKLYEEAGYKSVYEYAQEKYNITRTQALRFMQINDTYSIEGYSEDIEPKYIGYGSSKLTEMLGIPEEIRNEIPTEVTVKELRNVKAVLGADVEENTGEKNCATVAQNLINTECEPSFEGIEKVLFLLFKEAKTEFKKFYETIQEGITENDMDSGMRKDRLLCALAPSKFAMKRTELGNVLISANGFKIMFFGKEPITLKLEEFITLFQKMAGDTKQKATECYWNLYQEPLEEPKTEPKVPAKTIFDKKPSTINTKKELRASQPEKDEDEDENDEDEDKDQDDLDTEEGETDDETDTQEENHQDSMEETFSQVLNPPEEDTEPEDEAELEDNTELVAAVLENSDIEGYIPIIPPENLDSTVKTLELLNKESEETDLEEKVDEFKEECIVLQNLSLYWDEDVKMSELKRAAALVADLQSRIDYLIERRTTEC